MERKRWEGEWKESERRIRRRGGETDRLTEHYNKRVRVEARMLVG